AVLAAAPAPARAAEPRREVVLWHSYRDAEEKALDAAIAEYNTQQTEIHLEPQALPNEILASKISTAIPNGNGPDLFIFAHERVGGWAKAGVIAPVDETADAALLKDLLPETISPLRFEGRLYGYPLAFKSLALFYDRELVAAPPKTTDELVAIARENLRAGRVGLVYEDGDFYHHAPWYFGFGGTLFHEDGRLDFDSPGAIASLAFVRDLRAENLVPEEITGALVAQLFNEKKAAMVIDGPWFTGGIAKDVDFGVAPLPIVSATGKPARPFLTDEAVLVSAKAKNLADAFVAARFLAGTRSATIRAVQGRQAVANARAWDDPKVGGDPVLAAFRAQLSATVPMDNRPEMRDIWEPTQIALRQTLRLHTTPEDAGRAAMRRHYALTRPAPPPADPLVYEIVGVGGLLVAAGIFLRAARAVVREGKLAAALAAWAWAAPAAVATGFLIFAPFAYSLLLSLRDFRDGTSTFVGLANFWEILAARAYGPMEPLSFYYALMVTVLWTAVNVALHLAIGLSLALLLNRPLLKIKAVYRVLLIIPWAVPNYITALLWKGLFHKQFGAINGLLSLAGVHGVAWFSSFWTAFFANVCTNTWLGFPFMMVICLGALQAVPKDLYEAAAVDGAGPWSRFRHVTVPMIRPALVPALLLGTVWTFNQFNIVYLVSGGEPDNSTDILISEAYRWAFARKEQYGYASAYAALIFVLLLGWSWFSTRLAKSAEARA
ncbi:MAG TPA: extracellular solute-binding protein, partial [bacterium]|nr:extracellular solute-binding protein [bacterium]